MIKIKKCCSTKNDSLIRIFTTKSSQVRENLYRVVSEKIQYLKFFSLVRFLTEKRVTTLRFDCIIYLMIKP